MPVRALRLIPSLSFGEVPALKTMNARKGIKTFYYARMAGGQFRQLKTMNARKGIKTPVDTMGLRQPVIS